MTRRAASQPASRADYYRRLRLALGVRTETLARTTGFSPAYIGAIERGERPLLPHVEDAIRVALDREQRRVYADAVRLEEAA